MKIFPPDLRVLYLRELRSALRERAIVVNSILLPILLYPLLLWLVYTGITFVSGQTRGFSSRIALQGFPMEHAAFKDDLAGSRTVELVQVADPEQAIRDGRLDLLAEFQPPPAEAGPGRNFRTRLTYDSSKDRSAIARGRFEERLGRYRDRFLEAEAGRLGISAAELQQFWIEVENVASSRQMGQFILGLLLPAILIIMIAIGCMHPAIESTAGEREKSTWETSMTLATSRVHIVIAKYLYVATMAAMAGCLNLAAMLLSVRAVMAPILGNEGGDFSFRIPPSSIPLIVLLILLLSLFVAAGMMILASFARTFKEGQSLVGPFYIALILPVVFLQVPGLKFTVALALIPIVNVAMVFREAIAGTFRWPLIGITLAVEVLIIALALWVAAAILRYEDFLIGSYGGSFARFLKERLIRKKEALEARR